MFVTDDKGKHRNRILVWTLAAAVFVIAMLAVITAPPRESPEKLVWMTSAQLTQTLKPGKWTLLKYKMLRWPGPWRWMGSKKPQIHIETRVVAFPNGTTWQIGRADFCRTNLQGQIAWIATPEQLEKFRGSLKQARADILDVMRVTVADGMQASISSGSIMGGSTAFLGSSLHMLTKIDHGAMRLLVEAASTQAAEPAVVGGVQTNVTITCRATIPNGGALVVKNGERSDSGTNYCIIIICTAIDAKGNPIKL